MAGAAKAFPESSRVLVAEDNVDYREQIMAMLEPLALSCIPAADGKLAVDVLEDRSQEIVLVITDLEMPEQSGWDVIRAAREHRHEALPIIMQTGQAQYAHVWRRAQELNIVLIDKLDVPALLVPAVRDALAI